MLWAVIWKIFHLIILMFDLGWGWNRQTFNGRSWILQLCECPWWSVSVSTKVFESEEKVCVCLWVDCFNMLIYPFAQHWLSIFLAKYLWHNLIFLIPAYIQQTFSWNILSRWVRKQTHSHPKNSYKSLILVAWREEKNRNRLCPLVLQWSSVL